MTQTAEEDRRTTGCSHRERRKPENGFAGSVSASPPATHHPAESWATRCRRRFPATHPAVIAVALVASFTRCGGTPPPSAVPRPDDAVPGDSAVSNQAMIPDPVAVAPEMTVEGRRARGRAAARRLVTEGRTLARDSAWTAAADRFESAIGLDSSNADAYWELGLAYQHLSRWNLALDVWRELRRRQPNHPGLSRHLPILEMRRDRAAAADTLRASSPLPHEGAPRRGTPLRIAAVGDIQLGRGWPETEAILPPNNAGDMFNRVTDWLRAADITFGNLETVLADAGESTKCRRGAGNCYAFRAPTSYANTLRDVGFDVLSVNNNHAGDFGEAGRQGTTAALNRRGLLHSGPSSGLASWETHGVRVALLAFATGSGPFRVQDIATARSLVLAADRRHDLVIVSFHAGAEGTGATHIPKTTERAYGENRGDVFAFSRAMVDAGADLILGHGPHVLRGMEIYRERLIAYSLGNFSAWHGFNLRGPLGLSVVLNVTLAINGVVTAAEIHPVFLEEPGVPTPDPAARGIDIVRRLSRDDLGDPLFDAQGRYRRGAGSGER